MKAQLRDVLAAVTDLRELIEPHFSSDTAADGFPKTTKSSGHCAAVAVLMHELLGGSLASAYVDGLSHWFNRFDTEVGPVDVDITGDQFGLASIRSAPAGELFPDTRIRQDDEVNRETIRRASRLARRSGLPQPMLNEKSGRP